MLRRILAVAAVPVMAVLGVGSPARADHNTAHTIAQMTAHYQDPTLEVQNRPFALLYLRTTEGMRDAKNAGRDDIASFFENVMSQDSERAAKCHQFLKDLPASTKSDPAE